MITLVPFSQNHISCIMNQSEPKLEKLSSIIIPDARMSYTAMENGRYLGAGGLVPLWPRVAEAWVVLSAEGDRKKISVGRLIFKSISKIIETNNFVRVQATIHSKKAHPVFRGAESGVRRPKFLRVS